MDCARFTGEYQLESTGEERKTRRERLASCHELKGRIAEYQAAIKKETQFNRQMELNTKLKQLESQLTDQVSALRGD